MKQDHTCLLHSLPLKTWSYVRRLLATSDRRQSVRCDKYYPSSSRLDLSYSTRILPNARRAQADSRRVFSSMPCEMVATAKSQHSSWAVACQPLPDYQEQTTGR